MALVLILAVVLTLVSGVYAYLRTSTPSVSQPATSTATSYPLEMRTEVNKAEFQQGETIEVKMRLKNISNQTVKAGWSTSAHFDFNITDSEGVTVYKSTQMYLSLQTTTRVTLQPGGETTESLEALVVEGTGRDVYAAPLRLSEGEYKVIGFTRRFVARFMDTGQIALYAVVLQTPPITISVR